MLEIKKVAQTLQKLLKQYQHIAIFRHEAPDFDALGSQFGLYAWLKANYPQKKVYLLGENHVTFTNRLFPEILPVDDEVLLANPFLAIVLDTGDVKRISDKRFSKAAYVLKIDHHPAVENYGNTNYVETSMSAAAQFLCEILTSKVFRKYELNQEAARYLFIGIVGDSGRFQYSSTSAQTFVSAAKLLATNFDLQKDVYLPMYMKTSEDLKISAYVLANFKMSQHGVAYYYMDDEILKKYHITPERGKENINLLSNVEDIKIWVSFSEDKENNLWRVSIRSRGVAINEVAARHRGGGHKNASGASAVDIAETIKIIEELDELIK